jgi:hypothetical protein
MKDRIRCQSVTSEVVCGTGRDVDRVSPADVCGARHAPTDVLSFEPVSMLSTIRFLTSH